MPHSEPLAVLVVEDDPDTRANLRDILELDDYQVEEAGGVAEALARHDWPRYFAIILDRRLPDGSAQSLLPRLRALAPQAAVLIVTGYRDLEGALACLREGAADYILKPVNPDALRASLENIAERRRLHEARERSEAAFRHLVEAAECMIVMLREDGTICYFSPFAQDLTGHAAADALGRDFFEMFVRPADRAPMREQLARALSGHPLRGLELVLCARGGAEHSLLWNARRLDDYEGSPAVLAVGQDISARKRAEERAVQAQRLAAIGEMMTGLAHESRNALQRSKACLEMLALEVADRPEALDLVARVNKAQDHLHKLYEEVRGYAAPLRLCRQTCDLADVWREAWSSLALLRQDRLVQLRETIGGIDLHVAADAFALGQVFRNILENAIVACPERGVIEVRAAAALCDGQPAVKVCFRDNGPGLTPQQQEKIFEPFFTTKTKGTGLGMAIAKRIVEAHGGRIEAASAAGGGAEIIVTLPCQPP
jgi:two-component system sensor kinase FixL